VARRVRQVLPYALEALTEEASPRAKSGAVRPRVARLRVPGSRERAVAPLIRPKARSLASLVYLEEEVASR
jgi:hypothetical protein